MSEDAGAPEPEAGEEAVEGGPKGTSYHIGAQGFRAPKLAPGLYLVATPIGNLGDMTIRGLETLAAADAIFCEDTRVTRVLMARFALKGHLSVYHEHNAERERPRILALLAEGKAVALVSDAGTPMISDPGYKLAGAVIELGFKVIPIPGASALLAALVGAGLPTDQFLFAGFLPAREEARRQRIESLKALPATLVFYESPHRLDEGLAELASVLGADRRAVVARELTKAFEEFRRATLGELAAHYATHKARGEVVIVVAPAPEESTSEADVDRLLAAALERMAPGKAVAEVARLTGTDRKALYERALAMKDTARTSAKDGR